MLDTCHALSRQGVEVTICLFDNNEMIDLMSYASIRPDTILISVMHVNNETGVIQDIRAIGELAHEHGILHGCRAIGGKIPLDCQSLPVDLMSFRHIKFTARKASPLYVCARRGFG